MPLGQWVGLPGEAVEYLASSAANAGACLSPILDLDSAGAGFDVVQALVDGASQVQVNGECA